MSEDFKEAVKQYCMLHDEISASLKQIKEIRRQRDFIGETILAFMKQQDVEACELQDGKLIRKKSKRTEGLKKEHILDQLLKMTGGNEAAAQEALNAINSLRVVKETEILSRTRRRNSNDKDDDS